MLQRPWFLLFVAWLGWVFDIMDTALFNFAKGPMFAAIHGPEFLKQNPSIDGRLQTVFIIGWAAGGLIFGVLADRWSRTKTMALTIFLYALFTGLTAFCRSWEEVAAVRFLTGLGIGGEWAAGAALVAEAFEDKFRPIAAAVLQTAAAFGPWFAAALNYFILSGLNQQERYFGLFPWQWLFVSGVVPAMAALVIRVVIPEPPPRPKAPKGALAELFGTREYAIRALLVMIVGTVGIAGAGNAAYWLPNLVDAASEGVPASEVAARKTFATIIMHIGTLGGVFFFPWLAKQVGRRMSLTLGFVLALMVTPVLLILGSTYERILIIWPLVAFCAIGVSAVYGLYFPELFPSRIRATGAGFGYNTARLLQAPLPWLTGILIGKNQSNVSLGVAMAAGIYVLGILFVWMLPETKDKPLEA